MGVGWWRVGLGCTGTAASSRTAAAEWPAGREPATASEAAPPRRRLLRRPACTAAAATAAARPAAARGAGCGGGGSQSHATPDTPRVLTHRMLPGICRHSFLVLQLSEDVGCGEHFLHSPHLPLLVRQPAGGIRRPEGDCHHSCLFGPCRNHLPPHPSPEDELTSQLVPTLRPVVGLRRSRRHGSGSRPTRGAASTRRPGHRACGGGRRRRSHHAASSNRSHRRRSARGESTTVNHRTCARGGCDGGVTALSGGMHAWHSRTAHPEPQPQPGQHTAPSSRTLVAWASERRRLCPGQAAGIKHLQTLPHSSQLRQRQHSASGNRAQRHCQPRLATFFSKMNGATSRAADTFK